MFHYFEEIVGVEIFTNHSHRQPADELRLESVLDEIVSRHVLEQFVVHHLNWLRAESDLPVPDTARHLFLQFPKCAADNEQDMAGVDRLAFCFAAPLEFECGLQLRLKIGHAANGHFCFLHPLQQCGLHTASAHIPADQI